MSLLDVPHELTLFANVLDGCLKMEIQPPERREKFGQEGSLSDPWILGGRGCVCTNVAASGHPACSKYKHGFAQGIAQTMGLSWSDLHQRSWAFSVLPAKIQAELHHLSS